MQGFYFAMAAEQTAVGWEFPSLQSQSHLSVVSSQKLNMLTLTDRSAPRLISHCAAISKLLICESTQVNNLRYSPDVSDTKGSLARNDNLILN